MVTASSLVTPTLMGKPVRSVKRSRLNPGEGSGRGVDVGRGNGNMSGCRVGTGVGEGRYGMSGLVYFEGGIGIGNEEERSATTGVIIMSTMMQHEEIRRRLFMCNTLGENLNMFSSRVQ
jgi:hypothetical protein